MENEEPDNEESTIEEPNIEEPNIEEPNIDNIIRNLNASFFMDPNTMQVPLMSQLSFELQQPLVPQMTFLNTLSGMNGGGMNISSVLQRSMEDTGNTETPTDKETIKNLSVVEIFNDHIKCAICQESIKNGMKAIKLPCPNVPHYFCIGDEPEKCQGIKPWLESHNTCPICRFELPEDKTVKPKKPPESTGDETTPNALMNEISNSISHIINSELSFIDNEGFDTREFEEAIHMSLEEISKI
jgi:hypothetical protein